MKKKLFLIAGEPSGDALGAKLIHAIHAQAPGHFEIVGIGGPLMEAEGLESLLPMEELCVMGIWEVIMHLPRLYKLVLGVVEEIETHDPAAVITIDLPDFNFFVGSYLKKRKKTQAKLFHYVAPTVWAWRAGRAKMISKFLDGLMCLFPFEPPYFQVHKLTAAYVGHPLIEQYPKKTDPVSFRERYNVPAESKLIGVLLGSRLHEIKTIGPDLMQAVRYFQEQYPDMQVVFPTLPHLEFDVREVISELDCPSMVVTGQQEKWEALSACDAAMAVSGTVGLELAYAGVPHVIAYKAHIMTYVILKLLVRAKYAHLANILLDSPAVPECLQQKCEGSEIFKTLYKVLNTLEEITKQKLAFDRVRAKLHEGIKGGPSEMAAQFVISQLQEQSLQKPDSLPEAPASSQKAG